MGAIELSRSKTPGGGWSARPQRPARETRPINLDGLLTLALALGCWPLLSAFSTGQGPIENRIAMVVTLNGATAYTRPHPAQAAATGLDTAGSSERSSRVRRSNRPCWRRGRDAPRPQGGTDCDDRVIPATDHKRRFARRHRAREPLRTGRAERGRDTECTRTARRGRSKAGPLAPHSKMVPRW